MGQRWDRFLAFWGFETESGPAFSVDSASIPAEIFGFETYQDPIIPYPRLDRQAAIQVPAVKRGRDLICGTIGTIPLRLVDTDNVEHVSPVLEQPERNIARSVTMTRTVEDLVFEGVSWWKITERNFNQFPTFVERLPVRNVHQDEKGRYYVDRQSRTFDVAGTIASSNSSFREYLDVKDLVKFDSPTDPILSAGSRAIRTYLKLVTAADKYADTPMPSVVFSPTGEADPDDDDIETFLTDWSTNRQTRAAAYLPQQIKMDALSWNPEQLQMDKARSAAVVEIARLLGIDPEDLGVSTTSRTYQNAQDRRISMINDTLGMYIAAVIERLSMPDVTPRGYRVLADFNGFLRADDKTRLETYQIGVGLGIYDRDAIAKREGLPEPMFPTPSAQPAIEAAPVKASQFDAEPFAFGFDTEETRNTFAVDTERRTISGLAVPFGAVAKRNGQRWTFSKGSLTWGDVSRVKMLIQHDRSQAVGRATELTETDAGVFCRFKIARGLEGDRALALAEDGVYDGLSVGLANDAKYTARKDGVYEFGPAPLVEISLTPHPAFDDARVSAVVAEADNGKEPVMSEAIQAATPQFDMEALRSMINEAVASAIPSPEPVVAAPEVITPAPSFEINEPAPYVFDRQGVLRPGAFNWGEDFTVGAATHDFARTSRALGFLKEQYLHKFDVDSADVNEANPTTTRADLYVDEKQYRYPLFEATRKDTLTNNTPFIVPKWSSSSGLVAAHVEGTEPTPGAFVLTGQTVTPSALSGKVEITREVWDAGGNPNVGNLIFAKASVAYYEAVEAAIQAYLVAANASFTNISLTTGGGTTGQTLHAELGAAIAALNFVRGGFTFDTFIAQIDLYKAIAGALDDNGRPLFPIHGPQNSDGTASNLFKSIDVFGLTCVPGPQLEPTGTDSEESWIFDKKDVFTAASPPQRLDFQSLVEQVEIGIWGYIAIAAIDATGVRDVYYDPV